MGTWVQTTNAWLQPVGEGAWGDGASTVDQTTCIIQALIEFKHHASCKGSASRRHSGKGSNSCTKQIPVLQTKGKGRAAAVQAWDTWRGFKDTMKDEDRVGRQDDGETKQTVQKREDRQRVVDEVMLRCLAHRKCSASVSLRNQHLNDILFVLTVLREVQGFFEGQLL